MAPFFTLLARHFASPEAAPASPSQAEWDAARVRVDTRHMPIADDRIVLLDSAQVTLNGIAQGYVTDRAASILAEVGPGNALVDMGKIHALATHPGGNAWSAGLETPEGEYGKRIARTGGRDFRRCGFVFDRAQRFNHIFDPRTDACAHLFRAVQVAETTAADALSILSLLASDEMLDLS